MSAVTSMSTPDVGYRRVRVKNSRCLRDVELELAPLTVLVGPSASGKSALLEALMGRLGHPWQGDSTVELSITAEARDGTVFYRAERNAEDFIIERPRPLRVDEHMMLRLQADAIRQPNQLARAARLQQNGANATNVFASLKRTQQLELVEQLVRLVPGYADVDTDPTQDGFHRLIFQDPWRPDLWYPPEEVSDGTLMLLCCLTLRYHAPRVTLVAIEEPERSLHPWQIGELVRFLRALTTGELGEAPLQIVVSTHSPELLDHIRPEELRLVSRDADGATHVVTPTSLPDWQRYFDVHQRSLSSAWLAGAMGGVPQSRRQDRG